MVENSPKRRILQHCERSEQIICISITEHCRALLNITEHSWALLSIWSLLSIAEHYWALLSILIIVWDNFWFFETQWPSEKSLLRRASAFDTRTIVVSCLKALCLGKSRREFRTRKQNESKNDFRVGKKNSRPIIVLLWKKYRRNYSLHSVWNWTKKFCQYYFSALILSFSAIILNFSTEFLIF